MTLPHHLLEAVQHNLQDLSQHRRARVACRSHVKVFVLFKASVDVEQCAPDARTSLCKTEGNDDAKVPISIHNR